MANIPQSPVAPPPAASKRKQSTLLGIIASVILALIILVGIAVLIIWLAVRPRKLIYVIESAEAIQNYNLGHNQLNATFNFQLRAYNPNGRVSIYYDRIEAKVSYDDETLAFNTLQPFHQGKRNVTRLGINLVAKNVDLYPGVYRNMRMERHSGQIEVEVRVKAKIRFKVGVWRSRHRTLRLLCSPVMVSISPSKNFEMVPCDVDL